MGLKLIKATIINIYKTLAITCYRLSWPSALITSTAHCSFILHIGSLLGPSMGRGGQCLLLPPTPGALSWTPS